jgi:ketosteroid isomerase-like protein
MTALRHADARIARLVSWFEGLHRDDLARLGEFYHPDVLFKDPFNEVRSASSVRRVFEHMFDTLDAPRFVVQHIAVNGEQCFLSWDFEFHWKGKTELQRVRGCSHLQLAADGRIAVHRDYWDAAEELYAKLPLLGALMRWLRRRLSA